jgi:hypothetical protein
MVTERLSPQGAGDRCGTGGGLERFGVGEAGSVVADLAEDAGAEHGAQSREAGDDRRIGVLGECLAEGLFELGNIGHRGVQRPEMGQRLAPIACSTSGSWVNCSPRSSARIRSSWWSMLRRRPPRTSAARNDARRSF